MTLRGNCSSWHIIVELILLVQAKLLANTLICPLVSHFPSGESLDEMKLLEEQARRIAEEAREDMPKKKSMSFVK